jgi:hypothetical protein
MNLNPTTEIYLLRLNDQDHALIMRSRPRKLSKHFQKTRHVFVYLKRSLIHPIQSSSLTWYNIFTLSIRCKYYFYRPTAKLSRARGASAGAIGWATASSSL